MLGIIVTILGLAFLIVIHEFGHWAIAQLCGFSTPVFSIGFGRPYLVLWRWRNTEFRFTPWLLGGYVSIPEMLDETVALDAMKQTKTAEQNSGSDTDMPQSQYHHHPVWQRMLVAVAGVTMNVIFAVVMMFALFAFIGKPYGQVQIKQVLQQQITIAHDAGLEPGDIILAIDGQEIKTLEQVRTQIETHKSTKADLLIKRGEKEFHVSIVPTIDGRIGVALNWGDETYYESVSIFQAAEYSIKFNVNVTKEMFKGLLVMFKGKDKVHGIVGVVQIGAEVFQLDWWRFLRLLTLISLNLAVINVLPIPVLDGGHLLFFAIEAVRGKPLPVKLQLGLMNFFVILLFALMFYALFNDFFHPIKMH